MDEVTLNEVEQIKVWRRIAAQYGLASAGTPQAKQLIEKLERQALAQ